MSNALVDDLKAEYPVFKLQNRMNVAKSLELAGGEEIVVPPGGLVSVKSALLSNFPNFATFEYVSPTLSVLDEYGILERKSDKAASETEKTIPESKSTPINDDPKQVDSRAAGNQTVTSPTSDNLSGNNKSGQK